MESIQFGGRAVGGFGVGAHADGIVPRPAAAKVGAFVTGAVVAVVAGAAATALAGEGGGYVERVRRSWPTIATSALTGGIVGIVVA